MDNDAANREAAKKRRQEQEQTDRCYNRLFKTDDGRVVLKDLSKVCCIDDTTYHGKTDDMLICEGARRVFLRIAQKIRMDMTKYYVRLDAERAKAQTEPQT